MLHFAFERITYLEYKLKAKNDIIAAYESGEQYVKMQENFWSMVRHLESRVKKLEHKSAINIMEEGNRYQQNQSLPSCPLWRY